MSLRAFHIVFVTVTTLLFAFLAVWALFLATDRSATVTALGAVSIAGVLGMPVYGVIFYRKARKLLL
jgi:hypothetical protein